MKITPLDINNQKFRTRFRGFDVREVDEFLQAVAGELELQIKENSRLEKKVTELESRVERLKNVALVPKDDESYDRAEEMKASMLQEARDATEKILDGMKAETGKLKEEIKYLEKTKEQFEAYFESFLRFNIELLDTWNKREK